VAFGHADDVLTVAAKSIAEIITNTMHISTDFADIQTVMKDSGVAIMGSATAEGDGRAVRAAEAALDSPLLNDNVIEGASYILLNITSGNSEVTMDEVGDINEFIQSQAGQTADIIMGIGKDETLGDKVAVTVIATGFKTGEQKQAISSVPEKIVYSLNPEPVKTTVAEVKTPVAPAAPEMKEEVKPEAPAEPFVFIRNEEVSYQRPEITSELNNFEEEVSNSSNESGVFELEFPVEEEMTLIVTPQQEPVQQTPVMEEEKEEPIRYELPTPSYGQGNANQSQPMTPEEEMYRNSRERIMRLREVSLRLNSPSGVADMEKEPAYKRRNIKLENTPASGDSNVSRYTLAMDESQNKPEIRSNNTFLHDRVD
jgi:cell division protein FtsZ